MRKLPALLFLLLGAGLFFPACEVENCPPNALSYAHFTLVDQYGREVALANPVSVYGQIQMDVTVHDTLPDGSIQERVVHDSLISDTLINSESNASSFKLPLSYNSQTRFVIAYQGRRPDTVILEHRNIPYFINLDCGTMMFHEVEHVTYTHHQLDSLTITNPNIDNNEKENFRIYFTAADSE